MATTTAYVPFLEKPAPAHITLESLLDATGLTPPSPLSESVSNSLTTDIHSMPAMKCGIPVSYYTNPALYMTEQTTNSTENSLANEFQRQALLMDMCLELTSLLKDQDVNGYFLYPLPHSKYSRSTSQVLGLLDIEKQVFRKYYQSLSEFQKIF
ncbi:unnamed protein product [Heterobilharzia americana]|nr:unnamed protein product [Heterobilharzia americana]